jgi:hypothetical protein
VRAPEEQVADEDPQVFNVIHDPENPKIEKDALFPDIIAFRKAIRHYAVKKGFVFAGLKTDPTRFLGVFMHQSYLGPKPYRCYGLLHLCILIRLLIMFV